MSRSALMHALPDLGERQPAPVKSRSSVFEPLVVRASRVDEFEPLSPAGEPVASDDWPDLGGDLLQDEASEFGSELEADPFAATPEPGGFDDFAAEIDAIPSAAGPLDFAEAEQAEEPALEPLAEDPFAASLPSFGEETEAPGPVGEPAAAPDESAALKEEIEQLESAHQAAMAELVSGAIPRLKEEIVSELAGQIAPILARHLRAGAVSKAVAALTTELHGILADCEATKFELHGPQELLAAFEAVWDDPDTTFKKVSAQQPDLVARIDKTVVATRLGEFDRLIGEVLA